MIDYSRIFGFPYHNRLYALQNTFYEGDSLKEDNLSI